MGSSFLDFDMGVLLFLSLVGLSTAATIFEYSDPEKGLHHRQNGDPGTEVEGTYSFSVPEGSNLQVAYTAGDQGFQATADHLPVVPQDTEEVMMARSSFLEAFRKAEQRAVEVAEEELIDDIAELEELSVQLEDDQTNLNALEDAVVISNRRRRSPVTGQQSVLAFRQPVTYHSSYPLYAAAYPTFPNYQTYSPLSYPLQQSYYTYPVISSKSVPEPTMEEDDTEGQPIFQAPIAPSPELGLSHPVVRIGFQGINPLNTLSPVNGVTTINTVHLPNQVAPDSDQSFFRKGDDEAAALAL